MKTSKTLILALAVAVATVAGNATATGLKLNVSGSVKYQDLQESAKGTIGSHSFSEKDVYLVISNAVANSEITGVNPTNLPKDGYIAFNPDGYDGNVDGTFYVTNKEGFYYPLSGYDTDDDYYSFIELDTEVYIGEYEEDGYYWGFDYFYGDQLFWGADSYTFNENGTGSDTSVSKALLYIHDNPYAYADSDMGDSTYVEDSGYQDVYYPFLENDNSMEIAGILTVHFGFKGEEINSGSLSLSGTGNFNRDDYDYFGVVSSGHASFNK